MANEVKFIDNSIQVKNALQGAIEAYFASAGGELVAVTVRNTPVDQGHLKNSWRYEIDMSENKCTIGSPLENAIFNEFGTGEHALNHDGRKGGWSYQDDTGKWHHTKGKRPVRTLQKAFQQKRDAVVRLIEQSIKDAMK